MKKYILIPFLTIVLINISQAKAENTCRAKDKGWTDTCLSPILVTNGNSGSCGEGCSYTYSNGTINITADNENYENPYIAEKFFSTKFHEDNQFTDEEGNPLTINNVVIDGIIKFKSDAFFSSPFTISGKDGSLIMNDVDYHAMHGVGLTGNIIWRGDSENGFNGVLIDGNLIIEDSASFSDHGEEPHLYLGTNGKIFCKTDIEKCLTLLSSAGADDDVLNAAQAYPVGCSSLTLSGDCAKCEGDNFKLDDGICYRIRYTPAEAAEVVGETNTIFLYYR